MKDDNFELAQSERESMLGPEQVPGNADTSPNDEAFAELDNFVEKNSPGFGTQVGAKLVVAPVKWLASQATSPTVMRAVHPRAMEQATTEADIYDRQLESLKEYEKNPLPDGKRASFKDRAVDFANQVLTPSSLQFARRKDYMSDGFPARLNNEHYLREAYLTSMSLAGPEGLPKDASLWPVTPSQLFEESDRKQKIEAAGPMIDEFYKKQTAAANKINDKLTPDGVKWVDRFSSSAEHNMVAQAVLDAADNLPQLAVGLAGRAVNTVAPGLGSAAAYAVMASGEASGFMEVATGIGVPPSFAIRYAEKYGMLSGAIEYSEQLINISSLGLGGKVSQAATKKTLEQLTKVLGKELLAKVITRTGGIALDAVGEGGEELAQGALQFVFLADMVEEYGKKTGFKYQVPEGADLPFGSDGKIDWKQARGMLTRNFEMGAGVSLVYSALGITGSSTKNAFGRINDAVSKKGYQGDTEADQEFAQAFTIVNPQAASEVAKLENPSRADFEKAELPRMPAQARARFASDLREHGILTEEGRAEADRLHDTLKNNEEALAKGMPSLSLWSPMEDTPSSTERVDKSKEQIQAGTKLEIEAGLDARMAEMNAEDAKEEMEATPEVLKENAAPEVTEEDAAKEKSGGVRKKWEDIVTDTPEAKSNREALKQTVLKQEAERKAELKRRESAVDQKPLAKQVMEDSKTDLSKVSEGEIEKAVKEIQDQAAELPDDDAALDQVSAAIDAFDAELARRQQEEAPKPAKTPTTAQEAQEPTKAPTAPKASELASMTDEDLDALMDEVEAEKAEVEKPLPADTRAKEAEYLKTQIADQKEQIAATKSAPSVDDEAKAVRISEMNDELAEMEAELKAIDKPKIGRKGVKKAPKQAESQTPTKRVPRAIIDSAAKHGVKGIDEAAQGLFELFGAGKRLGMGLTFDEDTYAKAKPHFKAAFDQFYSTGKDVKELIRWAIDQFGSEIRPYLKQFKNDLASEPTKEAPTEAEAEKSSPQLDLAKALEQVVKSGEKLTWQQLFKYADEAYQGTRADGKYQSTDAYEALELAINRVLGSDTNVDAATAIQEITRLEKALDNIPTQTNRSGEKDLMQQFGTPPHYSFAATWVSGVRPGDVVLEPSGGIGGIAVHAKASGARVIANELSPRRAELLKAIADEVYVEDAGQLSNVLPESVKPTVVVMSPPFSQAGARMKGKKMPMTGSKHIEQALKVLQPGGRLVAIVGRGMAPGTPTFAAWWSKIGKKYNVRANVSVSGDVYAKYGTRFGTQLIVIDKVTPDDSTTVTGVAETVQDLVNLLAEVRNDRPRSEKAATEQASEQGSEGIRGEGEPAGVSPDGPSDLGVAEQPGGRDVQGADSNDAESSGSDGDSNDGRGSGRAPVRGGDGSRRGKRTGRRDGRSPGNAKPSDPVRDIISRGGEDTDELGFAARPVGNEGARPVRGIGDTRQDGKKVDKVAPTQFTQIIDAIRALWPGLSVRGKATWTRKQNPGWYSRSLGEIRLANGGDIVAAVHELGHHFDRELGMWSKSSGLSSGTAGELIMLGRALYGDKVPNGGYKAEGFAEFIGNYLTGANIRDRAPRLYNWFTTEYLPANPKEAAKLRKLEDVIAQFQIQTPQQAIDAFVSPRRQDWSVQRIAAAYAAFEGNHIDSFLPILRAMQGSGADLRSIKPTEDPFMQAIFFARTAGGRTLNSMLSNSVDLYGRNNGASLREVFAPAADIGKSDDVIRYWIAKRVITRYHDHGLAAGLSRKDAQSIVDSYRAESKMFDEVVEGATDWAHRQLHLLVEAGAMTEEKFTEIVDFNPIYAPMMRQFLAEEKRAGRGKGGKGVYKVKGGQHPIMDPLAAIAQQTERLHQVAMQHAVKRALVQFYDNHKDESRSMGKFLSEVPAPQTSTSFTAEKVKKAMLERALDLGADEDLVAGAMMQVWDEILTIYKPSKDYKGSDNITAIEIDGKTRFFEVKADLLPILEGITQTSFLGSGTAAKLFRGATSLQRLGATGLNPAFGLIRNLLRDTLTAFITGDYHFHIPVISTLRGMLMDITGSEYAKMYHGAGMDVSGRVGPDLHSAKNAGRRVTAKNRVQSIARAGLLDGLREILGHSEIGPRLMEFQAAYKHGMKQKGWTDADAMILAGCASKDVTVNFSRAGTDARKVNEVVLFYNAGIQSLDKFSRALGAREAMPWAKEQSRVKTLARTAARGAGFLTSSAFINYLRNRDDDWWKDLPPYEKWNYIHIKTWGDRQPIRMPIPFEIGYLFSSLPIAIIEEFRAPGSIRECLSVILENSSPIDVGLGEKDSKAAVGAILRNVALLGPLADILGNKDWKGADVVPRYLERRLPKDQVKHDTSSIGELIGTHNPWMNPVQVDHVMNGYTAGLYRRVASTLEALGDPSGISMSDPSSLPVLGTLFLKPGTTKLVGNFYERMDILERQSGSDATTPEETAELKNMRRLSRRLSGLWKQRREALGSDAKKGEKKAVANESMDEVIDLIREHNKVWGA